MRNATFESLVNINDRFMRAVRMEYVYTLSDDRQLFNPFTLRIFINLHLRFVQLLSSHLIFY